MPDTIAMPRGRAFVAHMRSHHGFGGWYDPAPNSREYKQWQRDHVDLYHGRWADQQDHIHA